MATVGTLYGGQPAQQAPATCPNRGRIMFWPELDGLHGDAQTLYCPLCGAGLARERYPDEARFHP